MHIQDMQPQPNVEWLSFNEKYLQGWQKLITQFLNLSFENLLKQARVGYGDN